MNFTNHTLCIHIDTHTQLSVSASNPLSKPKGIKVGKNTNFTNSSLCIHTDTHTHWYTYTTECFGIKSTLKTEGHKSNENHTEWHEHWSTNDLPLSQLEFLPCIKTESISTSWGINLQQPTQRFFVFISKGGAISWAKRSPQEEQSEFHAEKFAVAAK